MTIASLLGDNLPVPDSDQRRAEPAPRPGSREFLSADGVLIDDASPVGDDESKLKLDRRVVLGDASGECVEVTIEGDGVVDASTLLFCRNGLRKPSRKVLFGSFLTAGAAEAPEKDCEESCDPLGGFAPSVPSVAAVAGHDSFLDGKGIAARAALISVNAAAASLAACFSRFLSAASLLRLGYFTDFEICKGGPALAELI